MSTSDHTGSGAVSGEAGESDPTIEALAAAIDGADHGYSIRLTSLTDEGSTYTLDLCDGSDLLTFSDREDALDYAARHRSHARAKAALAALAATPKPEPETGGDLAELARLSEAAGVTFDSSLQIQQHPQYGGGGALLGWHFSDPKEGVAKLGALIKLALEVRKILSASSPPAVAGGADREEIASIIDPSAAKWWALGTHNGSAFDHDFAKWWDQALAKADAILALTPRPTGPGAQAQSPDLGAGADGWLPIRTAPKDGRTILVARYDPTFGWVRGTSRWDGARGIFGWISRGIADPPGELGLGHPTDWQPFPAPPDLALRTLQPTDAPIPESGEERS